MDLPDAIQRIVVECPVSALTDTAPPIGWPRRCILDRDFSTGEIENFRSALTHYRLSQHREPLAGFR